MSKLIIISSASKASPVIRPRLWLIKISSVKLSSINTITTCASLAIKQWASIAGDPGHLYNVK